MEAEKISPGQLLNQRSPTVQHSPQIVPQHHHGREEHKFVEPKVVSLVRNSGT